VRPLAGTAQNESKDSVRLRRNIPNFDMPRALVTLSTDGASYVFTEDEKLIRGRLCCDCTRSGLIREYCNEDFPSTACGNLISIEVRQASNRDS
jgi:hypothetical protein